MEPSPLIHLISRWLPTSGAVLVVILAAGPMQGEQPITSIGQLRLDAITIAVCEMDCVVCGENSEKHALHPPPNMGGSEGEAHKCEEDTKEHTCKTHVCDPTFASQMELTVDLLSSASPQEIRAFVENDTGTVVLNSGRNALQFVGCSGEIAGHVPLQPAVVRRISVGSPIPTADQ